MTGLFELAAQFGEVVDLAVEGEPELLACLAVALSNARGGGGAAGGALQRHRLASGRAQVLDREAPIRQPSHGAVARIDSVARSVWTAMSDRLAHPGQYAGVEVTGEAGYAAHRSRSPPFGRLTTRSRKIPPGTSAPGCAGRGPGSTDRCTRDRGAPTRRSC